MEQETDFVFHFPTLEGAETIRGEKEVLASAGSVWFLLWTFLCQRRSTLEQQHSVSSVVKQLLEPRVTQGPALYFIFKQAIIPPHHFYGMEGGEKIRPGL